jgi:GNAT superfamily N-acetyltransferase
MLRRMSSQSSPAPDRKPGALFDLREATVDDAEAIEAVHYAAREAVYDGLVSDWPPSGPDRAGRVARWRLWLASPDVHTIVAVDGDTITGFCTVRRSKDEDAEPDVAEMPTLYVAPLHWRRGLGGALCRASAEWAAGVGFVELTLWVLEVNERAHAFYRAFGFEQDGGRKVDEGTKERLVAHRYRMTL